MFTHIYIQLLFLTSYIDWITVGITALVVTLIIVNKIIRKKEHHSLMEDYNSLFNSYEKLNKKLKRYSKQYSNKSLYLLAIENSQNKFFKKVDKIDDLNELKFEIKKFRKELTNVDKSLEPVQLCTVNIDSKILEKIQNDYPRVSENDLKILTFLKLNLTNKEISNLRNVTVGAVVQSKRRLKKKLGLEPEDKLKQFLKKLEDLESFRTIDQMNISSM